MDITWMHPRVSASHFLLRGPCLRGSRDWYSCARFLRAHVRSGLSKELTFLRAHVRSGSSKEPTFLRAHVRSGWSIKQTVSDIPAF
jgi:hypothetical protein